MSPPRGEYGIVTSDGRYIWYAMIDESGHPYYDPTDPRPFTMGAIVTGRPEQAYAILSGISDNRGKTNLGERKHTHSRPSKDQVMMDRIDGYGYALIVASQPMYNETDYSEENGSAVYAGVLSRLLNRISEVGPEGLYRIRIDESEYLDEDDMELIARAAFDPRFGRELVQHSPVRKYDSAFDPPIQLADNFIGGYRKAESMGKGREYADRYGISLANRKPYEKMNGPGPAASSSFKTGQTDSGEVIAWEIPHPSESRSTGKPGLSGLKGLRGIRTLQSGENGDRPKRSLMARLFGRSSS